MQSNVSKYISLPDSIRSQTATRLKIDNSPTAEHLANMKLVGRLYDVIVDRLSGKVTLKVNSMYRSPRLNANVPGSSDTSQHSLGQAIDIDVVKGSMNNWQLFLWIQGQKDLVFDQLIYEKWGGMEWVHISYSKDCNRRQVKTYDGKKYAVYNGQSGQSCSAAMVAMRNASETAWAYIRKAKAKKNRRALIVLAVLLIVLAAAAYYLYRYKRQLREWDIHFR
jgi:hypothetical protein